ncbi:MAG: CHAT domain-containing protein [Leptolyngbyaceae cyanobacterium SM1_4_3]|nr:CHAT domain-containing protein [Leptolyngbyaceae cyanobacterium SM1_4_3]
MPKRIPLDSSFYQNLDKTIDFLRRSAYSKEPVFKVFLECKFHLPIGEPLSVKLWNDEVKEKYWREKYYFFSLKEGTNSWLGIELTYSKELLEAPITSKKFFEFLENKIKKLNSDLRQTQKISEAHKIVDNSQKNPSYGFNNVSKLRQLNHIDMTTKTVLFLAANPKQTVRLRLDEELREIDEGLRRANKRQQFKLEPKGAIRLRDFYRAILDSNPQIIHFSGHGEGQEGIILEDETGHPLFVEAIQLAGWFEVLAGEGVECVLLNACYSKEQAEAICQYVPYVIGMNQSITDKAAIDFAVGFYDALGSGKDIEFAFKLGRSQLVRFGEHEIPILLKKEMAA